MSRNARRTTVPAEPRSGADVLVGCLVRAGVSVLFGVPGDTGVVLYDALFRRAEQIRHVLARDERHAAFMADGYARATGRVGVVEVSSGGGSTYAIGGLGEAFAASVPVLVLTSDIQAGSRGTGALTETDQQALFAAVTKWQAVAESAADLPRLLAEALRAATTGRPAPVVLVVPENVLDEEPPNSLDAVGLLDDATVVPRQSPVPDADAVRQAARVLADAQRPAIVAGSGVHWSRAWSELEALADHAGIPVATTIHGKGALRDDSPWYLGVVGGNGGCERANSYLRDADAVLFVGTRANATDTDGWTAPPRGGPPIVQIDIDSGRAGRNFPGSIGLVGDAARALTALDESLSREPDRRATLSAWVSDRAVAPPSFELDGTRQDRLSASAVVQVVQQVVDARPHTVVADPGTPTPFVADLWRTPVGRRTVITPRGHGPMGYAIPAAVGVSLARPDDTVVAFTADGSFAMACGELETVARLGLPIVFIQMTNFSLGWIKMLQHLYTGKRYFGVDPGPIDAVRVAEACGLAADRTNSLRELHDAVASAVAYGGPRYIDVSVHHMIDDVPPVSSWHAALRGDVSRPSY